MDRADIASEYEELHRAYSLAHATPKQPARPAAERCADCGEEIPEARRQAVPGTRRCAFCQGQLEG